MKNSSREAARVQSPCVQLCKLKNEVCVGCGRTKRDVGVYGSASDEERKLINRKAAQRLSAMGQAPIAAINKTKLNLPFAGG
jgi:predicted Fe-S protein YdhL (DUF1289 family)